jgi:hypothetical protein
MWHGTANIEAALMSDLKERYRKERVALALGAGVSCRSGIPDWLTLLKRIAAKCRGCDNEGLVETLHQRLGYTLPVVAGMVENMCPKGRFTDLLRDALYDRETFPFYRTSKTKQRPFLVQHVREKNQTLAAVGAMCARYDRKKNAFCANPRIRAIINTNFDALLTAYTRARYGERLIRTIDRPSATPSSHRINCYHIHGFLQFWDGDNDDPESEAPDLRVLTEHEFFDFFDRPNSAFNSVTLHILREYVVLFIGLSLQDDNLRRLLHYSRQERVQSYIRERRKSEAKVKSLRHYAFQQSKNPAIDRSVEQSLNRLGVNVLWFKDFGEIPLYLKALYSDDGDRWSDVYP